MWMVKGKMNRSISYKVVGNINTLSCNFFALLFKSKSVFDKK